MHGGDYMSGEILPRRTRRARRDLCSVFYAGAVAAALLCGCAGPEPRRTPLPGVTTNAPTVVPLEFPPVRYK